MDCCILLPVSVTAISVVAAWCQFEPQKRGGYWSVDVAQNNEILILRALVATLAVWMAWLVCGSIRSAASPLSLLLAAGLGPSLPANIGGM